MIATTLSISKSRKALVDFSVPFDVRRILCCYCIYLSFHASNSTAHHNEDKCISEVLFFSVVETRHHSFVQKASKGPRQPNQKL